MLSLCNNTIWYNSVQLLGNSAGLGILEVGRGKENIDMHHGNFHIEDTIYVKEKPTSTSIHLQEDQSITIIWNYEDGFVQGTCREEMGTMVLRLTPSHPNWNRFSLHLFAQHDEAIWGCGEQFSFFNLRGKNYPLWTREQGVGRNKSTEITKLADEFDQAGGDYHTTFYPQTTFVSSRNYWCYVPTFAYADFDFTCETTHTLHFWELPQQIRWSVKDSYLAVVSDLSSHLGRQKELPEWVHDGITLGIQDGTAVCLEKLERAQSHGVLVNGIWAQDWVGQHFTTFGKRLLWNWEWNEELYPKLDKTIRELKEKGIRFLGYIN